MAKNIRNMQGNNIQDPSIIQNLAFNEASGAGKTMEVGRHLLPIPWNNSGVIEYTTNASTARVLPNKGICLAVYNNDSSIGSLTMDSSGAVVVLAPGVTNASGHVGIPCPPNSWTYIACADHNWIITSAATLLVFIIDDHTSIKQSAAR